MPDDTPDDRTARPASTRFTAGDPRAVEAGRVGGQRSGEARRQPRVVDLVRERVESEADAILGALFAALEAMRPVVVGNGPGARVELHPDHAVRLRAVGELLDRAYGRPTVVADVTTTTLAGLRLEELSDAELQALLAEG